MRSIEHVNEHHECSFVLVDSLDADTRCRPTAEAYVRNGAWLTPTLAIFYYYSVSEEDVENTRAFVRLMHRMGVRKILAGTDCEPMFLKNLGVDKVCHRGFALLQEVIALRESGLTPLEALQATTLTPAQFFEATDSLGTVATAGRPRTARRQSADRHPECAENSGCRGERPLLRSLNSRHPGPPRGPVGEALRRETTQLERGTAV